VALGIIVIKQSIAYNAFQNLYEFTEYSERSFELSYISKAWDFTIKSRDSLKTEDV